MSILNFIDHIIGRRHPKHHDEHSAVSYNGIYYEFIRMESMSREEGEELTQIIRTARYLEEASRLAPEAAALMLETSSMKKTELKETLDDVIAKAEDAIFLFSGKEKQTGHHDKSIR